MFKLFRSVPFVSSRISQILTKRVELKRMDDKTYDHRAVEDDLAIAYFQYFHS